MVEENGNPPFLCVFMHDAIENMISAVPYKTSKIDTINCKEYLFMCSKNEWYDIFVKFMKDK